MLNKVKKYNNKKRAGSLVILMSAIMLLSACGTNAGNGVQSQTQLTGNEPVSDTGFILYGTYDYDSMDTPVLVKKDTKEQTLTFLNTALGRRYTLGYDGTTEFYDRYGRMISLDQLSEGNILDIKFVKDKRHLTCANLSNEAWEKPGIDQYIFDSVKREVTIGADTFKIPDSVFCFSGNEELIYQELNSVDVLSFSGVGTSVYSIVVDKGHGYLRLTGHEYFVGGWIEVGTKYIHKITEEMLLTVPEGTYNIVVSGSGMRVDRSVTIKNGLETILDLSEVEPETPKEGMVLFSLTPAEATLFVDGEKMDTSSAVKLTYGLHQLICSCDGYTTVTRYLSVGEESAGVSIELEKQTTPAENTDTGKDDKTDTGTGDKTEDKTDTGTGDKAEDKTDTGTGDKAEDKTDTGTGNKEGDKTNTESSSSTADVTTTSYDKVYINAPANAQCYVDGNYVGVVPCSFKKETGSHVVTFSMTGYNTKSYTLSIDAASGDVSYSFTDLEKAST